MSREVSNRRKKEEWNGTNDLFLHFSLIFIHILLPSLSEHLSFSFFIIGAQWRKEEWMKMKNEERQRKKSDQNEFYIFFKKI